MHSSHAKVAVSILVLAELFVVSSMFPITSNAQDAPAAKQLQTPQSSQPMGMATGSAHAPVKDSKSRPITSGGFVDGAPVVFLDITQQSGLAKFHHRMGTPAKSTIL